MLRDPVTSNVSNCGNIAPYILSSMKNLLLYLHTHSMYTYPGDVHIPINMYTAGSLANLSAYFYERNQAGGGGGQAGI
jgi:hypothetical protein